MVSCSGHDKQSIGVGLTPETDPEAKSRAFSVAISLPIAITSFRAPSPPPTYNKGGFRG